MDRATLNHRHFWICTVCLASVAATPSTFARSWTLSSGDTVDGEFDDLRDGTVVLIQEGREITISLPDLSADDRTFVRDQVRRKRTADARVARTWTDNRGKTIRASLLEQDQDQVILLKAGRKVNVPIILLSPEDRDFLKSLTAQQKSDALAFAEAEREPVTSWKDFDFGPRVWTISGTGTEPERQINAELVSLDGRALLLKEVSRGAIRRAQTTELSVDDLQYLARYREAKRLRAEEIGGNDDLRVWKISQGRGTGITARLDRIEGDEVVLQSPEEDLRLKFSSLHDADKQFVREELTRRGTEVPAGMKRVKVANLPPPGREIREWTTRHNGKFQAWVEGVTPTSVHLQQSDPDVGMLQIGFLHLSPDDLEYLREKFPAESRLNEQLCPFCRKGLPTYPREGHSITCPHCEQTVFESREEKALEQPASLTRHDVQRRLMEARQAADQQRAKVTTDVQSVRLSSRSYRGLFKLAIFLVLAVLGFFGTVIGFVVRVFAGNSRENRRR